MHRALLFVACVPLVCPIAAADEPIYSTGDPFGGPMGVTGFDVWDAQSVAIRFTPDRNCSVSEVSLWLMCNTTAGQEIAPTLNVTLRADMDNDGDGIGPSPEPLVSWVCSVAPVPWQPVRHALACEENLMLGAGQSYWIVAESATPLRRNPVWNWSGSASGYVALRGNDGQWSCQEGVAVSVEVRGSSCGSADYNGDGDAATDQDIEAFFACIGGSCCQSCGSADFNGDGDIATDQDIESFFRVIGGHSC
ncbi:MAG TPA: hypothetical protein VD997_02370 [Phycisphaerales bacterium]|nr:hypothetical protein [Phycisphaerales bacterium]